MNQELPILSVHASLVERILNTDRIIILSAPAGFGKTEILKAVNQAVVRDDNKPFWFDRHDHKRDQLAAAKVIENQTLSHKISHRYFIIDDVDLADGDALVSAIEQAIHEHPEIRFVLALRLASKIPIARLLANDLADVVDGSALKLSDKASNRMLVKSVDRKWHQKIRNISGGWPVSLQSISKWAASVGEAPENWSTAEILKASRFDDYVKQEIVTEFDDLTRRALTFVSQFDCWTPALLAAVSDENFGAVLADLTYQHVGLIDRTEKGVVINPMLRSYFAHKFNELEADERASFLVAAADYQAENGQLAEASVLARKGGFPDRIDKYATDHGTLRIWVTDDYSTIKTLVNQAGPLVVMGSNRLKLMQCIVHMKDGLIKEAETLFQQIAGEIDDNHELKGQAEVVRVTLLVYGCNLERSGDLDNIERLFDRGKDDPVWRSLLATLSCILHSQRGRFAQALRSLEDARTSAKLADSTYNLMFLNLHQAVIHIARGEMKSARIAMTNARGYWRREFYHDRGVKTVISALSASIEFESGQLTTARKSLKKSAYQMPDSEAWFDVYWAAYEPMVRMVGIDRDAEAALRTIREHQRKLSAHGLHRVENILGGLAICLWGENKLNGIEGLEKPSAELPDLALTATWHEREVYTLARAHLCIDAGLVEEAGQLLKDEVKFAADAQLRRSELRYRLLLAVIYIRSGDHPKAEQALKFAIELGAETGLRQIFIEMMSVDGIHEILVQLQASENVDSLSDQFIARLLSAKERSARKGATTVLTSRESEILKALAHGGSDKMLAREFDITEHGIRFHLKSIYQKLAVHDRVSAVAAGRKIELF